MPDMTQAYITVAETSDIPPGSRLVVEIGRKWIVIFNVGGVFYALEDLCSHDEVPLSEGTVIDDTTIECSAHGACFDLRTGAVKAPPALVGVRRFEVRIEGEHVQIAVT
jgi:3-phenylpropionate/trans-cinnamate dioxygenase ferredoxin subunit